MSVTENLQYLSNKSIEYMNDTNNQPDSAEYQLGTKILFSCFMFPIIILSIADLAVAIFAMTLNAVQLLGGKWYFGSFMCRLWFAWDVLFSTASILHLFLLSVNLYLSISNEYSFYYKAEDPFKSWRVRIMISSVWLVSLLISTIPIFTDLYTTPEHALVIKRLDHESNHCAFVVNKSYRLLSSSVSFWIPGTGMIFFYTIVMKKANHMENNKLKIYNSVSTSARHNNSNTPRGSLGEVVWKRKYKAIKTLGTVITVFCICWVFFFYRYTFCGTVSWLCPKWLEDSVLSEDIAFWIGYFNSMINPFLYNFTNQDFRRAFRDLLRIKKMKYSPYSRRNSRIIVRL